MIVISKRKVLKKGVKKKGCKTSVSNGDFTQLVKQNTHMIVANT